jgi:hypothetical protein
MMEAWQQQTGHLEAARGDKAMMEARQQQTGHSVARAVIGALGFP